MGRPYFTRKVGKIFFHSRHQILDQMALEIIQGLPEKLKFLKRVHVYCGIHQSFPLSIFNRGFKLGIQTEQFFDDQGRELFGLANEKGVRNVKKHLGKFDCILDLSAFNESFYKNLAAQGVNTSIVKYGPHIFFEKLPQYQPTTFKNSSLIFFGSLDCARRKDVLNHLEYPFEVVNAGVYYNGLYDQIKSSAGVLNIHFQDAVYTEVPRMLTALSCGKNLISERLGSPFVEGENYHPINAYEEEKDQAIFTLTTELLKNNYSFYKFLKKLNLVC